MKDLLDMAARVLVLGGRLVYLLPCTDTFTEKDLPVHPCLLTVGNSEQKLSPPLSRRVITMEKASVEVECGRRLRAKCRPHDTVVVWWRLAALPGA